MPRVYTYQNVGQSIREINSNYELQKSIFEVEFGVVVSENTHYHSFFRNDSKPACYFKYLRSSLRFYDNNGKSYTAVDAIMEKYNLTFIHAIDYILNFQKRHNIASNSISITNVQKKEVINRKILFTKREWDNTDELYWRHIYADIRNTIIPIKESTLIRNPSFRGYALPFKEGGFRIYYPEELNDTSNPIYRKWGSDEVTKNSYWSFTNSSELDELIITKSFKDAALIFTLTNMHTLAFASEMILPELDFLLELVSGYSKIRIIYDNDSTGINRANNLKELLDTYLEAEVIIQYIEGAKDSYELISIEGGKELLLNQLIN